MERWKNLILWSSLMKDASLLLYLNSVFLGKIYLVALFNTKAPLKQI